MNQYLNLLFATILSVHLALQGAVEYDIIPLMPTDHVPTKDFLLFSRTFQMTDSGYIIGEIGNDADWSNRENGFVYHPVRGLEMIDLPHAIPHAVSERGLVAGVVNGNQLFVYDADLKEMKSTCDLTYLHPFAVRVFGISQEGKVLVNVDYEKSFLFDSSNPASPLQELPHDPVQISPSGDMISETHFIPATGEEIAFGSLDPYGRFEVTAYEMNDLGVVAGTGVDVQRDNVGFIWDQNSGLRSFGNLEGEYMEVKAINRASQVVGIAENERLRENAFFFDPVQGIRNLGTLGGKESGAFGINDLGQVVGYTETAKKSEDFTAFIWDEQNGMRDLNKLIPSKSGWKHLSVGYKINNQGWIIGEGWYLGEPLDFLLIPRAQ